MSIENINFNDIYKEQKSLSSFKMKSKEAWDEKAKWMNKRVHKSIYNDGFMGLIEIGDSTSLLDVGCGVGNLSLLLAKKIETINALDYSTGMLEILNANAKEKKIDNIHTFNLSWYDNWKSVPKSDIVIASRSMEVSDMQEALEKLNEKANKRVYLSYKVGGSFLSEDILKAMKREVVKKPDYIYVVNILYSMGINARVDFISSEGRSTVYNSLDAFLQSVSWSIGELSDTEKTRLATYYEEHVKDKGDNTDYVKWAVISWNKK